MRVVYTNELNHINDQIQEMGSKLIEAVEKTRNVLKTLDVQGAKELMDGDELFDKMDRDIESQCLDIVVTQAPVACDWRRIASVMRMVADLERIADHCSDIAEYVLRLAELPKVEIPDYFGKMFDVMTKMLRDTVEAFVDMDNEKANQAADQDDLQDDYFEKTVLELTVRMEKQPKEIAQYVDYLMIAKYLERMADHTTNLAEWIAYMVKGELKTYQ
ncbi:MAG: phosphate signaling complex protein PhoU [Lachnospiraceae bacterium]|nr:phosphate signaling complex protein PhoU [Candidatus Fimimorpha excrementavium]